MAVAHGAHQRRLDEHFEPSWASLSESLFRYGGIVVGLVILWLGFLTGEFFMLLTAVLAATAVVVGLLLASLVARESWYSRPAAKFATAGLLIIVPIAFVGFAQITAPALTPPPVLNQTFSGQLSPSHEQVVTVPVDPRVARMRFSISIPTSDGAPVRWFVLDPSAQSRWRGRTDSYGSSASHELEASPGQWTVHFVDDTGSAQFALTWQGWTAPETSSSP